MNTCSCRGYSLLELMVALAFAGIITGFAVFEFKALEDPAKHGAAEITAFFKKARSKALATTQTYTVSAQTATRIIATTGTSCSGTQTPDPEMTLTLPGGAVLDTLGWSVCYTTRGMADTSVDILMHDSEGSHTVQVVLGGAVRAL